MTRDDTSRSCSSKRKLSFVSVRVDEGRPDLTFSREIELALERAGLARYDNQPFSAYINFARLLGKVGLIRHLLRDRNVYVVPAMQVSEHRFFPVAYFHETIPYYMDCWERMYPRFLRCFKAMRCRIAFFSARQSADYFKKQIPQMECHWLPEACNPATYKPSLCLSERQIDVLELGRRHGRFHELITPALKRMGRIHRYQQDSTTIVFPTFAELISGFAQTRISVCFPGSMTNKEWAGNIETVTYRYFESMASRCVLLGHCPAELKDLFGYDPVIGADLDRPVEQIERILNDLPTYQELVDRNYQRLLEVGTWDVRIRQMLDILEPLGYVPAKRM